MKREETLGTLPGDDGGGQPDWRTHPDQITDSAAEGILVYDEDCRIVHVNPAAERIFGMSREELLGRRCDDPAWCVSCDGKPLARSELACHRALETDEAVCSTERTLSRPDGSSIAVLVSASPLRDDGRVIGVVNSFTDISELKHAEEVRREQDDRNKSLLRLYRELGRAASYRDIVEALRPEIERTLGYKSIWFQLVRGDMEDLLLLDAGGRVEESAKALIQDERYRTKVHGEDFLIFPLRGDPFLMQVMEQTDVVVTEDCRTDPLTNKDIVAVTGNRSMVSVPLVLAERTVGVLSMGTYFDEGILVPDEAQIDYLRALSSHVAVAIDRVRFVGELREARDELRSRDEHNGSLLRMYKELGGAGSYHEIVEALQPEIESVMGIRSVGLYLFREDSDDVFMLDLGGPIAEGSRRLMDSNPEFRKRIGGEDFLAFPVTGDPHVEALVASEDIHVDDDLMDPSNPTYSERQLKIATAISCQHTVIAAPLWLAGKKLGLLCLATHGDEGVHHTTEAELDYVRALSHHVAVATDRVRFLGDLREARDELRLKAEYDESLLRLYKELGQADSYRTIVDAVRPEIERIIGFRSTSLALLREETNDFLFLLTEGPMTEGSKRMMESDDIYHARVDGEDFRVTPITGRPHPEAIAAATDIYIEPDLLAADNPRTSGPEERRVAKLLNLHTVLTVPLFLAERKLGVLDLTTHGDEGVLIPNEAQLDYLRALANHVAVAVDRVRFLGERREAQTRLETAYSHLGNLIREVVDALASTTKVRDPYTTAHQERVARLAVEVARELGMADEAIEGLRIAALLHDIGKIGVPTEILVKPSTLSEIEMGLVRTHSALASDLIGEVEFTRPVATIVRQHHERLDGSGYPDGLTGAEMLPESKVLAVADVVEAMSSDRPYRPALGIEAALAEVEAGAGRLYDADAVAACLKIVRETGRLP